MPVKHYILTRYNCVYRQAHIKRQTPAWCRHRMAVFRNVTLPSVKHQTDQNFTWLVGIYDKTPIRQRRALRKMAAAYKNMVLVPVPFGVYPSIAFRNWIRARKHKQTIIVTSRLDSDDGLHPSFVAITKRRAIRCGTLKDGKRRVINFKHGFGVNTATRLVYELKHNASMFISLVEPAKTVNTVYYGGTHIAIARKYPKVQVAEPPGWVIIVHAFNIANNVRMLRDRRKVTRSMSLRAAAKALRMPTLVNI